MTQEDLMFYRTLAKSLIKSSKLEKKVEKEQ